MTIPISDYERSMLLPKKQQIISTEKQTHSPVNDISCGEITSDYDSNLQTSLDVADKYGLNFNGAKSTFGVRGLKLLGFEVSKCIVKADPDRPKFLLELQLPKNLESQ